MNSLFLWPNLAARLRFVSSLLKASMPLPRASAQTHARGRCGAHGTRTNFGSSSGTHGEAGEQRAQQESARPRAHFHQRPPSPALLELLEAKTKPRSFTPPGHAPRRLLLFTRRSRGHAQPRTGKKGPFGGKTRRVGESGKFAGALSETWSSVWAECVRVCVSV